MKRDEELLLQSDEVLLSLAHRSAFLTIKYMPLVADVIGILVVILFKSPVATAVGISIIGVGFATTMIYEVILGYNGVSRGMEELRKRTTITKRQMHRKMIEFSLHTASVWFAVSRFAVGASLVESIMESLGVGLITAFLVYSRWNRTHEKRSTL